MFAVSYFVFLLVTTYFCLVASTPGRRIIGGTPASPGEFPHQVSLRNAEGHFCGGSIIHASWVLTAGHCVDGFDLNSWKIWAGFVDESHTGNDLQERSIIQGIIHDQYDELINEYDIGLFKVNSPFEIGGNVKVINLPSSESVQYQGTAVVTGWGATTENGPSSSILFKVEVDIFPWKVCNEIYEDEFSELLMCAGHMDGGKDACQGDSGGPLTCEKDGQQVLCAVIAAGQGCARPNFPGLYTPTSKYLSWIKDHLN